MPNIVQLHTLEQWSVQPPEIRAELLRSIQLKERIWRYLDARQAQPARSEVEWSRCKTCNSSWPFRGHQQPGFILKEPRYDGLHPSQIGGECLLKIYWEMQGLEGRDTFEPRMQFLLDFGTEIHNLIQDYGEDGAFGPFYRKEVPISGDYQELARALMLEGSADAENVLSLEIPLLVPDTVFELAVVHEYKSSGTQAFDALTQPKPKHVQQAMLYGAALNRPVVVYVYVNKNDSNIKDYAVQFDPVRWSDILSKTSFLVQHFNNNTPPEATPGYHCDDCKFSFVCPARRSKTRVRAR